MGSAGDEMSHKYSAVAVQYDGYLFDSKCEAQRYQELKLLEQAGQIRHLLVHPRYCLQESFTDSAGKKQSAITYVADFKYVEIPAGNWVVEDMKGVETPVFRLKAKMFRKVYPNLDLRIIKC